MYLSIYLSINLCRFLCMYVCMYVSIYLSIYLSIYVFFSFSIPLCSLSIYLSICFSQNPYHALYSNFIYSNFSLPLSFSILVYLWFHCISVISLSLCIYYIYIYMYIYHAWFRSLSHRVYQPVSLSVCLSVIWFFLTCLIPLPPPSLFLSVFLPLIFSPFPTFTCLSISFSLSFFLFVLPVSIIPNIVWLPCFF